MLCFIYSFQIFFQSFLFAQQSSTPFVSNQFKAQASILPFFCPRYSTLYFCLTRLRDWSRLYRLVMATHWPLYRCRRNADRGIHLLPSQAGWNILLLRSSAKKRGDLRRFCVCVPRGPNPHYCLPITLHILTFAELRCSTAAGSARLGGGEARRLRRSHPLAHPENSYFQKITFCLVLFMDLFTLSTQPPICHQLKPLEAIHS